MTPSSPAPSKRPNHSSASARSRRAGREVDRSGRAARAPARAARAARPAAARAGRDRPSASRSKATKEAGVSAASFCDARGGRVQAQLQSVEVEPARAGDHDLAVDHGALRQAPPAAPVQLREVAVERPQVAALDVQPSRRRGRRSRGSRPTSARTASPRPPAARSASFASIGSTGGAIGKPSSLGQPRHPPRAPGRDAPLGGGPAGVEGQARLVDVDRPAARGPRASACPCAPRGRSRPTTVRSASGARHQQVVDAHAEVLVEVAGAVVPPRVAAGLGVVAPVRVDEPPAAEAANASRSGAETWVPPWHARGSQTSASSGATLKSPPSTSGSAGSAALGEPARQALVPGELGLVEGRADHAPVGRVQRTPRGCRRRRAEIMRASASGSSSPASGVRAGRSGWPKLRDHALDAAAARDRDAVPAALAVMGQLVAGVAEDLVRARPRRRAWSPASAGRPAARAPATRRPCRGAPSAN